MPAGVRRETLILEEDSDDPTQGHYAGETMAWDAAAGQESEHSITLPMKVALLSAFIYLKGLNDGDCVGVDIAPDTLMGNLPSDIGIGATVIPMPASMKTAWLAGALRFGARIKLDDGTNADELGLLLAVDEVNDTFTVRFPTTYAFASATPTAIKYTVSMSPGILCNDPKGWTELKGGEGVHAFGQSKIGGSNVPSGKVIRCRYKNTGAEAVRVLIGFEFLY